MNFFEKYAPKGVKTVKQPALPACELCDDRHTVTVLDKTAGEQFVVLCPLCVPPSEEMH